MESYLVILKVTKNYLICDLVSPSLHPLQLHPHLFFFGHHFEFMFCLTKYISKNNVEVLPIIQSGIFARNLPYMNITDLIFLSLIHI